MKGKKFGLISKILFSLTLIFFLMKEDLLIKIVVCIQQIIFYLFNLVLIFEIISFNQNFFCILENNFSIQGLFGSTNQLLFGGFF